MDLYYLMPLASGFIYALASFLTKRALAEGAGIMRFAFVSNWVMLITFSIPLVWQDRSTNWDQVLWPIMAGACFFVGQVFTFAAIRIGDVSIQTPLMGTKVIFVSIFSIMLGVQTITADLWLASFITALAVALLGYNRNGYSRAGLLAMGLALSSALFFGLADVVLGKGAPLFGPAPFLSIMMVVNAALSVGLIPFFKEGFRSIPSPAWIWITSGAILIGIQSGMLGFFFANIGKIAEGNILYSSRGIWSVVLGIFLAGILNLHNERMNTQVLIQRLIGALLMSTAIWIVLS